MNYRDRGSVVFEKKYYRQKEDPTKVCETLKLSSGLVIVRLTEYEKKLGGKHYVEVYENRKMSNNFDEKWREISYKQFKEILDTINPDRAHKISRVQ